MPTQLWLRPRMRVISENSPQRSAFLVRCRFGVARGRLWRKQPFGDATLSPLLEGKTEIAKRWSRGFGPFAAVGVGKAISKREFCHDPSRSKQAKSKFRAGRAFYLRTLLPKDARQLDAHGATWRFAIAQMPDINVCYPEQPGKHCSH